MAVRTHKPAVGGVVRGYGPETNDLATGCVRTADGPRAQRSAARRSAADMPFYAMRCAAMYVSDVRPSVRDVRLASVSLVSIRIGVDGE